MNTLDFREIELRHLYFIAIGEEPVQNELDIFISHFGQEVAEASAGPPEHNPSWLLRYWKLKCNSGQLCGPVDLCEQQTQGLFLLISAFVWEITSIW